MTGTGFPNAVPQDSSNRETGKKTTRSAIGAKAHTILDFLRRCTPYEADSIRVMVGHATGKGDTDTIEATDLLAVNRFLNHGLTKENATGNEAVMRHRQERVQKLMSNRNRYRMKLKRTRNFPLMTFHRRGRESFRYPILIRHDLSVYPAMDGCGRQYCFQPFYPYKQRGRIEQIQWQTGRIRAFCCSPIRQPSGTCLLFQWPMQGTCGMKRQR